MKVLPVLGTSIIMLMGSTTMAQYLADNRPPNGVQELYQAGEKAYRAGDHATAITLFSQVIEVEPDHLNAHLQRGFCQSLVGAYQEAVDDFSFVLDKKSDHSWALISRGSALGKLGKHDLAIADLDRVIAADPKNQEAFNNRGWSKKATGDLAGACKDWNTSKRMGNSEAKIILTNNRCK